MSFTARPAGTDIQIASQQDANGAEVQQVTVQARDGSTESITSVDQILFSRDVSNFASYSIQFVHTSGFVMIRVEGSNDNTNWLYVPVQNENSTSVAGGISVADNMIVFGPAVTRYLRAYVSWFQDGSEVDAILELHSVAPPPSAVFSPSYPPIVTVNALFNDDNPTSTANPLPVVEHRSVIAAVTAPTVGTTAVQLLAANDHRHQALIYNVDSTDLYVKMGSDATTDLFSIIVAPNQSYTLESPGVWTGSISAIRASSSGTVMVTEFS